MSAFKGSQTGHVKNTTCAAMSPNGQWVVSGDVTGALRLWGAKGEHAQKNEYKLWDAWLSCVQILLKLALKPIQLHDIIATSHVHMCFRRMGSSKMFRGATTRAAALLG